MANEIGGADETIIIEYVVKTDDAIRETEALRERINEIKAQLLELSATTGTPYEDIAKGMVKAFNKEYVDEIKRLKEDLSSITSGAGAESPVGQERIKQIKEEMEIRKKAWLEYKEAAGIALAEVNKADKQVAKDMQERQKETAAQQKESIRSTKAALDEYIQAWKKGDIMSVAAQKMGQEIQQLKERIRETADQTGKSFEEIGQAIANNGEEPVKKVTQAVKELNEEEGKAADSSGGFASALEGLGDVGKTVFGVILGLNAKEILQNIVNWFSEAAKAGFEYAQALLRLEAATQILQEGGLNTSMKETLNLVRKLNQEFPIFTRRQVIEGVGYIQLLSQNLKLSSEEMADMSEVASALAVVLGKDVNDAARELALFLSSGYGEALQRAGILASKQAVVEELRRMGIKQSYNDTDQATRAQAGYNVVMRDANRLLEKAVQIQKENAFAMQKARNAWQQFQDTVGIRLVPVLDAVFQGSMRVIQGLTGLINFLSLDYAILEAKLAQVAASIQLIYKALSERPSAEGLKKFAEDWAKVWSVEGFQKAFEITRKALLPDIFTDFTDSAIGAGQAVDESAETINDAVKDLYDELTNLNEDYKSDAARLERDLYNDLEKLTRDWINKSYEAWLNYQADIARINRKTADDIVGENTKYQLDVLQVNRDFNNRIAEANKKHRDREYKAQKDFEEKLLRLREDFLFDLEDALRERDARQVLRLIRRFNLEQDRLRRERESQQEEQDRAYSDEVSNLEKQRQERLQILAEEHQARLVAIERQRQIELRELQIKYEAELEELKRRLLQEKEERRIRAEEQREELKIQFNERLKELAFQLGEEYSVTAEMLNKIIAQYQATYGAGGSVQQIFTYFLEYLNQVNQAIAASIQVPQNLQGIFNRTPMPPVPQNLQGVFNGYAVGAKNKLVTSPTLMMVGEVPEVVNITPVNRLSSSRFDSANRNGTISIELLLSPDLQARVMDNTLDQVANIMLDVQRRR